jgi:hypothetical protein
MSDSSDEDKQEKVTEALTKNVITWVKLDDQIRENRAQTKILLDEKKKFEQFILEFLENTNEKVLEISDGRLRRNVSKTKAPLKKETIFNSLKEITKDEEKSLKLTEYIINNRAMVERINLKRTRNRGSKKKN